MESMTKVSKVSWGLVSQHLPLALRMEVNTAHGTFNLIETDIVKSLEAGARNGSHPMVGNKEIFFPSHEHVLTLSKVAVSEISPLRLFGKWFPSRKTGPMVDIRLFVGAPFLIASLERVFSADNLSFKECGQGRVVFCEACFGVENTTVKLVCKTRLNSTWVTDLECEDSRIDRTQPCPRALSPHQRYILVCRTFVCRQICFRSGDRTKNGLVGAVATGQS